MDDIWNWFHQDRILGILSLTVFTCSAFLAWSLHRQGFVPTKSELRDALLRGFAVAILLSVTEALDVIAASEVVLKNALLRAVFVVVASAGSFQMALLRSKERRSLSPRATSR